MNILIMATFNNGRLGISKMKLKLDAQVKTTWKLPNHTVHFSCLKYILRQLQTSITAIQTISITQNKIENKTSPTHIQDTYLNSVKHSVGLYTRTSELIDTFHNISTHVPISTKFKKLLWEI